MKKKKTICVTTYVLLSICMCTYLLNHITYLEYWVVYNSNETNMHLKESFKIQLEYTTILFIHDISN